MSAVWAARALLLEVQTECSRISQGETLGQIGGMMVFGVYELAILIVESYVTFGSLAR